MRISSARRVVAATALLALGLLTAAPVQAQQSGRYHGQCRKLTKQISHFQDVAGMAIDRNDMMWLASTAAHIERLRDRRSRLCPQYDRMVERIRTEEFWRDTYALTIAGAKAAMSYFTMGAY